MVNEKQEIKNRTVKVEQARSGDPEATAKGGLAAMQALANRLGLWNIIKTHVPPRKDPTQGFTTEAAICALAHGLLAGGQGFSATEAMRGDAPLLKMLGLERAPSAETVEEVLKYLADENVAGEAGLNTAMRQFVTRSLQRMNRKEILDLCYGFVPVWVDGSLLEVGGKTFDSIKYIHGKAGQLSVGAWVGPWIAGACMAGSGAGEGELTLGRALLGDVFREVIEPLHLQSQVLLLNDSLYGDEPTLDQIEALSGAPSYIIGAAKLDAAWNAMHDYDPSYWRETGPDPKRGFSDLAWARGVVRCADWEKARSMVCRRTCLEGEYLYNYFAVLTNLEPSDARVQALMKKLNLPFEETIFHLYAHKQAMENQWKDLLSGLGIHHPPCARAAVNSVFLCVAALACNVATAFRQLCLKGKDRAMQLWRLRLEVIDIPAVVAHTGRVVTARLIDARDRIVERVILAMLRLSRL